MEDAEKETNQAALRSRAGGKEPNILRERDAKRYQIAKVHTKITQRFIAWKMQCSYCTMV